MKWQVELDRLSEYNRQPTMTILGVFQYTFGTKDYIELLNLRSSLIDDIREEINVLSENDKKIPVLNEISLALASNNLMSSFSTIAHTLSDAHIATLELIFEKKFNYMKDSDYIEIVEIIDSLKEELEDEDLKNSTKEIIIDIIDDVELDLLSYSKNKNKSISKMKSRLIVNAITYNISENIHKKSIIDKIKKLFEKVTNIDKKINSGISIVNKISELLEYIPNL